MFSGYCHETWTTEGRGAAEPFIDDNAQCILIASGTGFAVELLWSHVQWSADDVLHSHRKRAMGRNCNAKIAQQNLIVASHQHIFRFDMAMDKLVIVDIL